MENRELILKAIRYIQKNPTENLSLQSIADNAGFSLSYFDKLFQQHTGYSAIEYSRVYKLTRAAHILRLYPERSVLDIALDYGYASPETFARAFRSFYGVSPVEYREKHISEPTGWKQRSSRIAIGSFARAFPEMRPVSEEVVFDLTFTYNPMRYFEDLIDFIVADTKAFTLDDPDDPHSVVCASDYDVAEPCLSLICPDEADAIRYLHCFSRLGNLRFALHKDPGDGWDAFDRAAASAGFLCHRSLDMIYPYQTVDLPAVEGFTARELNKNDYSLIADFQRSGGCGPQHLHALQLCFEERANLSEHAFGLFRGDRLIGLATPVLDVVRDIRKYDFGAIFFLGNPAPDAVDLLWKTVIAACLADGALFGAAGAKEDDSPEGVAALTHLGMTPVAEHCIYEKE